MEIEQLGNFDGAGQHWSAGCIKMKSRLVEDVTVTAVGGNKGDEPGSAILSYGRKDPTENFPVETIQIQFGLEERQFLREKVIRDISEIADILNARLEPSRTD